MKKISLFICFLIIFLVNTAFCADNVLVTYRDSIITCDVQPYIENSRTLIPVRMAEQLGYNVEWNEKDRSVNLTKGIKTILLKIGSNIAKVDGKDVEMDVSAKITSSRTFVPVRFVAENFGYTVDWESDTRTVVISDPKSSSVTDISTKKTADSFQVKIFSSAVIDEVEKMVLESPVRYIFDIQGAMLTIPNNQIAVNSSKVASVRYSQFSKAPDVVRVVVELTGDTKVTSGYVGGIYTISVEDEKVPTVTSLKLTEEKNKATAVMTTDMTLDYKTYKLSNPSRFVVEIPDSDIAVNDVEGNGEVIENAKITRKDGITMLTLYLAGAISDTKCSITQKDNTFTVIVTKTVADNNEEDKTTVSDGEFLIVIDPGHGGDEPGSLGMVDGKIALYEKDVNLDIGKRVYEKLLKKGYNVIATRTEDVTVSLQKRVEIANTSKADLFVSIHNNSFESSSAKGTLTMYAYDTPKEGMEFSGKEIASIVQPYLVEATGSTDRELMENSKIYVTAKTNMPAILCECLFMSNPSDLERLLDEKYIEKISEGIVKGVESAVKHMKN